ncbi:MAG: LysR family transcriptional regulator [Burkholderiales bacterium]|nr:LysR family transcriptional regulator [Burkholderiales bacterium]
MINIRTSGLTIKQLRAFVAVYQLRSVSAAAAQLCVTQSAVSVLIRQMEGDLGVRLFDRTTRSLQPTAAADGAIEVAQRVLRDLDSLGAGLADLSSLRRGRITIACTPALARILLPAALNTFLQSHPDIHVDIDDCAPDQFFARLLGDHVDFGLGTPDRAGDGVKVQRLMGDHLSVICRADHPMASRKTVPWQALDGLPVIAVRPGYGVRALIDQSAARAGIHLNVAHEVALLSTALWMTACGVAPSVMPAAYATYGNDPDIVARPLVRPAVSRDIYVLVKAGRSLSPAARKFVEVLKQTL